ncbi:hypothetical protein ROBYS_11720 [Roseobacter sp. OBYS 0001]|nr:hypothetical protein ROBYS_11720 [Roseobacter sp. OBYS 0001]
MRQVIAVLLRVKRAMMPLAIRRSSIVPTVLFMPSGWSAFFAKLAALCGVVLHL